MTVTPDPVEAFIARWQGVTASELATAQSFVIGLRALLDLAEPHATPEQDYMFERPISFRHGDGSSSRMKPRAPLERYTNPRPAEWPVADVVVGNPPFIGNKRMRIALGDGYVDALRGAWEDLPESADFVMFWWHHAAQLAAQGSLARYFGTSAEFWMGLQADHDLRHAELATNDALARIRRRENTVA